jgi:hypothetical protein
MSDFRVLILVLASDNSPFYCKLQSLWKTAAHPRADVLFLKAHPNIQGDDFIHENTVYIGCPETLDNVYEKQMRSFRVLRPRLKDYAFVFRTNLSSHVDVPMYLEYCERLPRQGVYRGVIGNHKGTLFASGAGYTITPDLIERLVHENPPEVFLDDVSVGYALASWGIEVVQAPRKDYSAGGWLGHRSADSQHLIFHSRVRSDDRNDDLRVLTALFENSKPVVVHETLTKAPFWMIL